MSTKNICDLVMLVPHLGDGGTQKVVTTLANEWNKKGKKITVITIYDHSDDYVLEPGVKRIKLNEVTEQYDILTMLSLKLGTFSQKIKELKILYLLCLPIIYLSVLLINITRLIFFILRFSFILIIKFKEILVSFKDYSIKILEQSIFYIQVSFEYLIGFFINIINDLIDEFIGILEAFKSRYGFGFYGISYYFIMGIFYTRKCLRKTLKALKKLASLKIKIKILDINFNINIKINIRSIRKSIWRYYRQKKKEAGPYLHIINRAKAIRGIIKSENPPVILSFIGSTNILTTIACKFLGKKVVISERNDPALQRLNHPYNRLRPYVYSYADVVTANTQNALETMKEYVPQKKLIHVPNPLDLNIISNGFKKGKSKSYILSVGRLSEQKAYDVLLNAFKIISPKLENWRLIILGKGELKRELHRQSEELGISHLVDWKGHVSNPYKYYSMADIYVLPSRHEGMSNSLLEAMCFGLPYIVSDACQGSLEQINDNGSGNGLVVPVDNHIALADAILKLANDEKMRKEIGNAAKRTIRQFDLPVVLKKWEEILGL